MVFYIILGIVVWVSLAFWPAVLAKNKGYNFWLFLILSWFVSFLITLIVVLFLPNKLSTAQEEVNKA